MLSEKMEKIIVISIDRHDYGERNSHNSLFKSIIK